MAGTGQEMWAHACDSCMKMYNGVDGETCMDLWPWSDLSIAQNLPDLVSGGTTDGIAMGHTRCVVHDCRLPLMNQTHRFCSLHNDRRYLCSVYGCGSAADPGFSTCGKQSHRAWEETRRALPQLRARYQRAANPFPKLVQRQGSLLGSVGVLDFLNRLVSFILPLQPCHDFRFLLGRLLLSCQYRTVVDIHGIAVTSIQVYILYQSHQKSYRSPIEQGSRTSRSATATTKTMDSSLHKIGVAGKWRASGVENSILPLASTLHRENLCSKSSNKSP
jgi:hypothetical protein